MIPKLISVHKLKPLLFDELDADVKVHALTSLLLHVVLIKLEKCACSANKLLKIKRIKRIKRGKIISILKFVYHSKLFIKL